MSDKLVALKTDRVGRAQPTNLHSEPPYPGLDTVVFLTCRPDFPLTVHLRTKRCTKDYPHEIENCGEWQAGDARREGGGGDGRREK